MEEREQIGAGVGLWFGSQRAELVLENIRDLGGKVEGAAEIRKPTADGEMETTAIDITFYEEADEIRMKGHGRWKTREGKMIFTAAEVLMKHFIRVLRREGTLVGVEPRRLAWEKQQAAGQVQMALRNLSV